MHTPPRARWRVAPSIPVRHQAQPVRRRGQSDDKPRMAKHGVGSTQCAHKGMVSAPDLADAKSQETGVRSSLSKWDVSQSSRVSADCPQGRCCRRGLESPRDHKPNGALACRRFHLVGGGHGNYPSKVGPMSDSAGFGCGFARRCLKRVSARRHTAATERPDTMVPTPEKECDA